MHKFCIFVTLKTGLIFGRQAGSLIGRENKFHGWKLATLGNTYQWQGTSTIARTFTRGAGIHLLNYCFFWHIYVSSSKKQLHLRVIKITTRLLQHMIVVHSVFSPIVCKDRRVSGLNSCKKKSRHSDTHQLLGTIKYSKT